MESPTTIAVSHHARLEAYALHQMVIRLAPVENYRLNKLHYRLIKRAVDVILGSFLTLFFLSWMIPLLAVLIKLDSTGPVFFIQKRTGLRGKSFYCLKFRTMYVNKEANRMAVEANDKRITRVGYYLRKHHIDELPQLLNVIIGNMSLVGPRPHMLRHTVLYSRVVENYDLRHQVKPGIAGLAQMRGYHDSISTLEELHKRCSSDFEYIEKWTPAGDVFIFLRTIMKVLKEFFNNG